MFKKWKEKWKVSWLQFILIICTFACGGSLCGIASRKLLGFTSLEKGVTYFIIYIITISILWPFCVLLISIPLGQYAFFKNYIHRMGNRMIGKVTTAKHIAIFASGAGSNAAKIIKHLQNNKHINVKLIVCNKPDAGVLEIAKVNNIETLLIEKEPFFRGDAYVNILKAKQIDFIVLAGFLWKVPIALIKAYPNKIVNIHPALLPKYGGKGMYGHFVHEAVVANGETESGITIHYVNENFDEGRHIFQASCAVSKEDTPDTVAAKIHQLEHLHFPRVVEEVVLSINK
jgi:formyltetrahydrofolate-dependent phosphoribosylglycinamide formyltransferase